MCFTCVFACRMCFAAIRRYRRRRPMYLTVKCVIVLIVVSALGYRLQMYFCHYYKLQCNSLQRCGRPARVQFWSTTQCRLDWLTYFHLPITSTFTGCTCRTQTVVEHQLRVRCPTTVLGPLLFALFMSPISNVISSFGVSQMQ